MGPRLVDRGELLDQFVTLDRIGASMGPRLVDRGEARRGGLEQLGNRSFNGAAVG